jgi:hypothetical protein
MMTPVADANMTSNPSVADPDLQVLVWILVA